jgi:hypothetical protein
MKLSSLLGTGETCGPNPPLSVQMTPQHTNPRKLLFRATDFMRCCKLDEGLDQYLLLLLPDVEACDGSGFSTPGLPSWQLVLCELAI